MQVPPPQTVFAEADLASAYLRRFYAEWSSKRLPHDAPSTAALSANAMRWALGKYTLIDVEGPAEAQRFRYSYCSWEHVTHFGNDLTDTMVEDNPDLEIRARALAAYRLCVASKAPVLSFRALPHLARAGIYQALILPYRTPEIAVARLLVAIDFEPGA